MKNNYTGLTVLAVLILLGSMILPMFNIWAGIIPTDDYWSAGDTFEAFSDYGAEAIQYYGVLLHLATWITSIVLLVSALAKKKPLCIVASLGGLLSLVYIAFLSASNMEYGEGFLYDLWEVINFEDGNFSVGYWIILVLFVISFFKAIGINKNSSSESVGSGQTDDLAAHAVDVAVDAPQYCENCGTKLKVSYKYCPKCGYKVQD